MSETFRFELSTVVTLRTMLNIKASSLEEAQRKFLLLDKRQWEWEVADPPSLLSGAVVTQICNDDGTVVAEGWGADFYGQWSEPA